ncbi:hypothetical protein LC55x_5671 [Lysobacter capsici]|nr:hypothetical protein LC55x_5671 [Lysobacter capsici]
MVVRWAVALCVAARCFVGRTPGSGSESESPLPPFCKGGKSKSACVTSPLMPRCRHAGIAYTVIVVVVVVVVVVVAACRQHAQSHSPLWKRGRAPRVGTKQDRRRSAGDSLFDPTRRSGRKSESPLPPFSKGGTAKARTSLHR